MVVEPDPNIVSSLHFNIKTHQAQCQVFHGVISKQNMFFIPGGLSSRTRCSPCSDESTKTVIKTLDQIIKQCGLKFNTLVADCEGCLEQFIDENLDYINNFKLITYEMDWSEECDYGKIERILRKNNFVLERPGAHMVWKKEKADIKENDKQKANLRPNRLSKPTYNRQSLMSRILHH